MTTVQIQSWKRLFIFWILVVIFAISWGGLLILFNTPSIDTIHLSQIPLPVQTSYIIGLYLYLLWLCHKLGDKQIVKHTQQQQGTFFVRGSLISISSLGLIFGGFIFLNWAQPQQHSGAYSILLLNLGMALSIAGIEELVFRGFMLSTLIKAYSWQKAIFIQALWYALLHLLRSDLSIINWLIALVGLGLTGILLGHLRQRTHSLSMGIGLHAGWIWLCSSLEQIHILSWNPQYNLWTGHGNPVYGLSGCLLLIILLFVFPLSNSLPQQDDLCHNESTT